MHLYILARGHKDKIERWENDLLARYYPYEHEKGKPKGLLQLSVREVKIYEIVFPEEHMEEILQTIKPKDYGKVGKYRKLINFFAKILGLEKVPEYTPDNKFRVFNDAVGIHAIGIKRDEFKNGIEFL